MTNLISGSGRTAILEIATATGLELVDSKHRNPLYTKTCGVGEMIADAPEPDESAVKQLDRQTLMGKS